MPFARQLAILLLLAGVSPAKAEEPQPKAPETEEQRTLEAYGMQNEKCDEWSDGCAVCMRQDGAKFACSLPGIACQPTALACRREKDAAAEKPTK